MKAAFVFLVVIVMLAACVNADSRANDRLCLRSCANAYSACRRSDGTRCRPIFTMCRNQCYADTTGNGNPVPVAGSTDGGK